MISTTPVRTRHIYNGLKVIQEYTVTGSGGGQVSTLAREFIWVLKRGHEQFSK